MLLQNSLGKGQPYAVAHHGTCVGCTVERFEDMRQIVFGNADALVTNHDKMVGHGDGDRLSVGIFDAYAADERQRKP